MLPNAFHKVLVHKNFCAEIANGISAKKRKTGLNTLNYFLKMYINIQLVLQQIKKDGPHFTRLFILVMKKSSKL